MTTNDPEPLSIVAEIWSSAAEMATVGIFLLLLVLYLGRAILLPVLAAVLVGTTFAPIIKRAIRLGVPAWLTAVILVTLIRPLSW